MTRTTRLLIAATVSLLGLAGARAQAQTCSTDTDCPQSYVCVVSGTSTPPACKGTDCPADTGAAEPVTYRSCEPKDCATDADCGAGMVCYDHQTTSCTGGGVATSGCAPNTKCDAGTVTTITPETCTTTSRKLCAFKWQVPCSADTDCGDGFVCQPSVSGGCGTASRGGVSGSTGSASGTAGGTSSGGSSPPAAIDAGTPECMTVTSFPGSCTPKATTCAADAECPSGWTCTAIGTPQPVTGTGASTPARGSVDATSPPDAVDAGATTTKICIGPLGAGAPTRGTDLGAGGEVTSGHQGSGGAAPPASPGSGATGGPTGNATGGTTGSKASSDSSGGGCAMAPARPGRSAFVLIGLAAAGLTLARRRRRQ